MIQQQEAALLAAFRSMHPEDREIMLDFAQARATKESAERRKVL